MCRLHGQCTYVLLAILSAFDATNALRFLVCDTSLSSTPWSIWELHEIQNYWCVRTETVPADEYERWCQLRYTHFDRVSMDYREDRGISRDNMNSADRGQPRQYARKEDDPSYHLWTAIRGPSPAMIRPVVDIPEEVLKREEAWKEQLDILYDYPHPGQKVVLLIGGHELIVNSFHYDPKKNLTAPLQTKSRRRGFIDISETAILYRYIRCHVLLGFCISFTLC